MGAAVGVVGSALIGGGGMGMGGLLGSRHGSATLILERL